MAAISKKKNRLLKCSTTSTKVWKILYILVYNKYVKLRLSIAKYQVTVGIELHSTLSSNYTYKKKTYIIEIHIYTNDKFQNKIKCNDM